MRLDATDYDEALRLIMDWAVKGESRSVFETNVHSAMESRHDSVFWSAVETADLVTPGGVPLVWMLRLGAASNQTRVYGPELMLRTCAAAAASNVSVGLYGSTEEVMEALTRSLGERYPALRIGYSYSPPFRDLTKEEDDEIVAGINGSGVRILFVGLGCPRQEKWIAHHRGRLIAVMLGVGAAFDFISKNKPQAPLIFQRAGLEWVFRLATEPRRLWYRYLVYNPKFIFLAVGELIRNKLRTAL